MHYRQQYQPNDSVLLLLQRDWSQGGINSVRALYYSTASQLGLTPSAHNVPSLVVRPAAAALLHAQRLEGGARAAYTHNLCWCEMDSGW